VLLAFYLNDSRPSWGFPTETRHRGWLRRHSLIAETIYERLALKRWLKGQGEDRFAWIDAQHKINWKSDRAGFAKLVELAAFDWGAAWQKDSWRVVEAGLKDLISLSQEYKFKTAILVFPVYFQVYADFVDDYPQQRIKSLAALYGIPIFDLLELFRSSRNLKLFYDQCHLTPEGSLVAGRGVAQFLTKLLKQERPR